MSSPLVTLGRCLEYIKTSRCGVIVYTIDSKNDIHFLLAKHQPTGQLGDLGGGVKKNEHALDAGVREFIEESRGIFSLNDVRGKKKYDTVTDFHSYPCFVIDGDMAILFVEVDPEWLTRAGIEFRSPDRIRPGRPSTEISDLVWVTEERLRSLIFPSSEEPEKGDVMWKRIRIFLQKSLRSRPNFFQYLRNRSSTPDYGPSSRPRVNEPSEGFKVVGPKGRVARSPSNKNRLTSSTSRKI